MRETDHAPESWARCSLKDIVVINPKNNASPEQTAGFVPMALAPTDYHGALHHEEKLWGEIKKSYTNFSDGDVIFAKVTPCFENGKAAIVRNMPNGIGAGSSEFYVLRPASQEISPSLLFAIIKTQSFMQQGAENMTGAVGLRRVPRAFVESFPIALPPAAEQKVIADNLDILLTQVENTKARLERIPQILKRFRQSVLAAAVSGRLTEEWRESADLIGWEAGELGRFVEKPRYCSSTKSQKSGDVPVLRMGNLQDGKLDWADLVYTSDLQEIEKYRLEPGDVLFNRTNSPELVGKTSIFRGEREAIYAGYLIKIKCLPGLNSEFLNYQLNSPKAKDYCKAVKSDGVSQSNINAKKLAAYPLHCPPLEEQTEIVRRVDQLFAHADRIEQQVNNALARVNNLTQSILAKAFRGELTEQWRKDNPELISGENSAEALFERIKAERAAIKPVKKTRKKVSS